MGEVVRTRGEVEHRLMTAALSEERRGDEVKQLPLEGAQRHGHIAHIMWRVDRAVLLNDYLDSLDALTTDIVERIQQFWIQRIRHFRVLHSYAVLLPAHPAPPVTSNQMSQKFLLSLTSRVDLQPFALVPSIKKQILF